MVVADDLRGDAFGLHEIDDRRRIVLALGVGPRCIEVHLCPAAAEHLGQARGVDLLGVLDGCLGVAELSGYGDLVDGDVGRSERCPAVVGILTKCVGEVLGSPYSFGGGLAVAAASSDDCGDEEVRPGRRCRTACRRQGSRLR